MNSFTTSDGQLWILSNPFDFWSFDPLHPEKVAQKVTSPEDPRICYPGHKDWQLWESTSCYWTTKMEYWDDPNRTERWYCEKFWVIDLSEDLVDLTYEEDDDEEDMIIYWTIPI
jgi:hypothetical protein